MSLENKLKDFPGYISSQRPEDEDSVSTLGSCGDNAGEDANNHGNIRSIFENYWSADEKSASAEPTFATNAIGITDLNQSVRRRSLDWSLYHYDIEEVMTKKGPARDPYGYEDCIKMNEAGRTVKPSAAILNVTTKISIHLLKTQTQNPRVSYLPKTDINVPNNKIAERRKIFECKYPSFEPFVPSYEYNDKLLSSVQPSNSYTKKMLRSSLRRDRSSSTSESLASMEESMISKSTRLSVSFDPRVSIHEYTKPCESYIMDGWSNYFSR